MVSGPQPGFKVGCNLFEVFIGELMELIELTINGPGASSEFVSTASGKLTVGCIDCGLIFELCVCCMVDKKTVL